MHRCPKVPWSRSPDVTEKSSPSRSQLKDDFGVTMRRWIAAFSLVASLFATASDANDDVFMQAVAFALTGSDTGPVEAIIRADCVFKANGRTFYLNNVHTDRIFIKGWRNDFGQESVTVELRGGKTVVEYIDKGADGVERLVKEGDWTLRLDTNEQDRMARAWGYVYSNGCTGTVSPF